MKRIIAIPEVGRVQQGFTLIELMITIVVIGILASIAYPSYTQYMLQARRAEAQSDMLKIQLGLEKWRANNNAYSSTLADVFSGTNTYYTYTITGTSGSAYIINATAITGKSQVNDVAGSTSCTPLTLNQSGTKGPTACWKK